MGAKFEKFGDWNRAMLIIKRLKKEAEKAVKKSLQMVGEKGVEISKGHLTNQDLAWKPLKESTINAKVARGDDPRILVSSNRYYQAISSQVSGNGVFAGIKKGEITERGDDLTLVAAVHEFGALSIGIEARPLWQPTLMESIGWAKDEANPAKILLEALESM